MKSIGRDRNIWTLSVLLVLSFVFSYAPRGERPVVMAGVVEPVVLGIGRPVQKLMWVAASQTGRAFTLLPGNNNAESRKLRDENARLKRELRRLQYVDAENERLCHLLGFRENAQGHWIGARVVGRSSNTWFWQMTIDQGQNAGIKIGSPVCSSEGLVGQVVRVGRTTADVLLTTDWGSGVGAIDPSTGAIGIIQGRGGPDLLLTYLVTGSKVHEGDAIETSGLGGVFPAGERIGKVTSVSRDKYSVAISATIAPDVDFRRLNEVLVRLPSSGNAGD